MKTPTLNSFLDTSNYLFVGLLKVVSVCYACCSSASLRAIGHHTVRARFEREFSFVHTVRYHTRHPPRVKRKEAERD